MSNPTTGYICTSPPYAGVVTQDLSAIFLPLGANLPITFDTNFNVQGHGDLRYIFAPLVVGSNTLGYNTNFVVTGHGDLQNFFAPSNTQLYYKNATTNITDSHNNLGIDFNKFAYASEIATNDNGQYTIIPGAYNYQTHSNYGGIIISNDFGYSFTLYYPDDNYCPPTPPTLPTSWEGCSINSSGNLMLVGNTAGNIYKSTDYGTSWSYLFNVGASAIPVVARLTSDNICHYNYAILGPPGKIVSFDENGNIITTTLTSYNANQIVTNSTGQYVYFTTNNAGSYSGGVYYSSNYGSSYTASTTPLTAGTGNWIGITCDSNGQYVYASEANNKSIYYSINYGVNFAVLNTTSGISGLSNLEINTIATDKTGNVITVAMFPNGGGIYQSTNVLANPTSATWSLIGVSSTQQYTYWTSVACDNNTGLILTMGTAIESGNISSGGLYTNNYFPPN